LSRRHSEPLPHLDTVFVADGGLIGGIVAWYAGTANLAGVEPDEASAARRPTIVGVPPRVVPNFAKALIVGAGRGVPGAIQAGCV
jgi:threonine dehydratase